MNKSLQKTFVLVLAVAGLATAQHQKSQASHEQAIFSEENSIQKPVALPRGVLSVLLRTKEVKNELRFASDLERRNPEQLFRAAGVHLTGSDEIDLVVVGVRPMSGADNDWFWVVLSPHTNPMVALFDGCNVLELLSAKTNGYRNIRTTWSSASQTVDRSYRFDGKEYKLWKEKWREKHY